jgi:hypothetical protein
MTPQRILLVYRWVFVTLIALASIQTIVSADGDSHALLLASVEIAAALMLPWRRTAMAGLIGLLLVFAIAQILTAHAHAGFPTHYLQYAASAILIVTLGAALERNERLCPRDPVKS